MTKLNNTTTDAEFQKKFKSKINFGDLLDKNDKKNEGTTVSGLLKSTTQTIVAPNSQELDKKLEDIEQNIERKVERVESLLQSVIISQQNFQLNVREDLHETFKDKLLTHNPTSEDVAPVAATPKENKNIVIASAIISLALIVVAGIFNYQPAVKLEPVKEVKKVEQVQKVQKTQSFKKEELQVQKYVATKFVNMRDSASTKASILMVVPPNSVIELLQTSKGWNKIKFSDHVKGTSTTGWVYGENLKALN